jgi:hypothetical protein
MIADVHEADNVADLSSGAMHQRAGRILATFALVLVYSVIGALGAVVLSEYTHRHHASEHVSHALGSSGTHQLSLV